jgi:hypothetical protein
MIPTTRARMGLFGGQIGLLAPARPPRLLGRVQPSCVGKILFVVVVFGCLFVCLFFRAIPDLGRDGFW